MTINLGRPATTPCPSGETTFCIIHSTFTPLMNPLQLCWPLSICVNTIQKWTKSRTIAEATDNRVADYQKPFCKKNLYSGGLIFTSYLPLLTSYLPLLASYLPRLASYLPGDGPLHRSLLTPRAHWETSCQCCRHRKERMMLFVLRVFMPSKTTDSWIFMYQFNKQTKMP